MIVSKSLILMEKTFCLMIQKMPFLVGLSVSKKIKLLLNMRFLFNLKISKQGNNITIVNMNLSRPIKFKTNTWQI